MEIIKSLSSSSKKEGVIHFYKEYISFQLESDHSLRKLFYSEIETVLIQNSRKVFLRVLLFFSVIFLLVTIYFYLFEDATILNIVSGILLVILSLSNWIASDGRMIQVKKEGLLIDMFYSNKKQEVLTVFNWLQQKLNENPIH